MDTQSAGPVQHHPEIGANVGQMNKELGERMRTRVQHITNTGLDLSITIFGFTLHALSCSAGVAPRRAAEGTEGLRRPECKGDDGMVEPGGGDSDIGGIRCLPERRKPKGVGGLLAVKSLGIGNYPAKCAPSRYLSSLCSKRFKRYTQATATKRTRD